MSHVEHLATMEADPLAYLAAPLMAPSLHVVLSALWAALAGQPELALAAAAHQAIAWLALEAFCLASISPLLWLFRRPLLRLSAMLGAPLLWSLAVLAAAVASFALLGPLPDVRSPAASWFAALVSAAAGFAAMTARRRARDSRSIGT